MDHRMGGQRLLVVDDDPDVCEVVRFALEESGYEIECVHSGPAALARLRASRYDLALIDHRLPGGVRIAEIVDQAVLTNAAVVLMSGDLDAIEHFDSQPHLGLSKPFRIRTLLETVTRALGGRGHQPERT